MIGAIVGDIVGSRFEFNNIKTKDFELFDSNCCFTDDSVMTIAVAKAVKESNGNTKQLREKVIKYMQEFGRKYPYVGYGSRFREWINTENPEPYDSYGNGAAMRVSACGFYGETLTLANAMSDVVTIVSHNHPEGIKGARAVTTAIYLAKNGADKKYIKDYIEKLYYSNMKSLEQLREKYYYNESCQGTVPQAIECFIESTDFEDAIRNAICIGGDSDTIGAITGSIAEAFYGVPDDICQKAYGYLDKFLLNELKNVKNIVA